MKSLFFRIFVSFWAAMTLIGAAFAVIYALGLSSERADRRARLFAEHARLAGAELARCVVASGARPPCADELARASERGGLRVQLYERGELAFGSGPAPAGADEAAARAAAAGGEVRHAVD